MPRLVKLSVLLAFGAAACVGDPPASPVDASAGPDGAEGADAAPPAAVRVSGKTKDYFTGMPLSAVGLRSEGMEPQLSATTDGTGDFAFPAVPPGSAFYLTAMRTAYRPTRGLAVRVEDMAVVSDQPVVSLSDTRRQYATLGLTAAVGTAVVFAELQKHNGTPLTGVPLTDVKLVDAADQPVGLGPYAFGPGGDLVPVATQATTVDVGGRARVGFLDVPPGSYTLKVTYTAGAGTPMTDTARVDTTAEGASLALTGGTTAGGMGGGGGGMARTFTADVYPRLQTAANGGLACANCHTAGGAAAVLPFDGPVQATYDAIKAAAGVVDLATPANSMLLTKPLYEDPPNHPNATFLDANDPDYIVILAWITQGANL